jgi:hypothetical protein
MAIANYAEAHHFSSVVWVCNEFRVVRIAREHHYSKIDYVLEEYDGDDSMKNARYKPVACPEEFFSTFQWTVQQLGAIAEAECRRDAAAGKSQTTE